MLLEDEDEEEQRRRSVDLGYDTSAHLTTNNTNAEVAADVDNDDGYREEHLRPRSSPTTTRGQSSVIDQLFERLNSLSSQLESAVELSSSLQAQHAAAQGTISALESKVTALESVVASSPQSPAPSPIEFTPTSTDPAAAITAATTTTDAPPSPPDSPTQMLTEWKITVERQWTSVREEWASERERLASAQKEWESKVRAVECDLGATAAKFGGAAAEAAGLWDCDWRWVRGCGCGLGGLVTPPSLRSLSADLNGPRQRKRRSSSSPARGRSSSRERGGGEGVDRGAESESSTTSSMHLSLEQPYISSLADDSSDADADSPRKDSTDSVPSSLSSKDVGGGDGDVGVHQLETPESSVHRAPVTSLSWIDSPVADSPASSIVVKEDESEGAGGKPPSYDVRFVFPLVYFLIFESDLL